MSTKDQKVHIVDKKFMTTDDFGQNFLGFLEKLSKDVLKLIYPNEGFFTRGILSSSTADTISISTPMKATDGLGNILSLDPAEATVPFENRLGATYSIGLRYVALFVGTEVNVRTGQIEYKLIEDAIGEIAEPDVIIDQGTTLKVIVNSVTEAGVDNSGRVVRIFLKRATGQADAFFDGVVQFDGANNFIQTTHLLGQTVGLVERGISKYRVFLIGPSIKKYTDLSRDPNVAFVGKVKGAGAGNIPTDFDQTSQVQLSQTVSDSRDGLLAQVLTLIENGGTLTHDADTLGRINWSQDLKMRPLGTVDEVTVTASFIDLAEDEVAFVKLPKPFSSVTVSMQKAPRSSVALVTFDRFWIFHRIGNTINVRGGLQLEKGEQRQLEDIVIGNSVFFSDDDRIRFSKSENIFHFDADGGSDNADIAVGEKVFFGGPSSQNFVQYLNGLLTVLFNNTVDPGGILAGLYQSERTNATDSSFQAKVSGNTEARLQIRANGSILWGDGNLATDLELFREAVGLLSILGTLRVSAGVIHAGDFANYDFIQFVEGVTPAWKFRTNNAVRAIIDESGNFTAGRDVKADRDVRATRDSLTGLATNYQKADGRFSIANASLNEVYDETLSRKLLRISPNGPNNEVLNIASSQITAADGSHFSLSNHGAIVSYAGGTVNFATGRVTGSGSNFIPYTPGTAGHLFKYGLALNSNNELVVILPTDDAAITTEVSDPNFETHLPVGIAIVRDNGGGRSGTIHALEESSIVRLRASGGGQIEESPSTDFMDSGFIMSDGTLANGIARIVTVFDNELKKSVSEITPSFSWIPGLSPGKPNGDLVLKVEGLELPREYVGIDPLKTMFYKEMPGTLRVRISEKLETGPLVSIHIQRRQGSIDTSGQNRIVAFNLSVDEYDAKVGSSADVTNGVATHSSLAQAISDRASGDTILIRKSYVPPKEGTVSINKKLKIVGQGHSANITSSGQLMTIDSNFCQLESVRWQGHITINNNGCFLKGWKAPDSNITNNGRGNEVTIVSEEG